MLKAFAEFIGSIGIFSFMYCICGMKLTDNKKRIYLSVIIMLVPMIIYIWQDETSLISIILGGVELIVTFAIFQTDFMRGCSVFLFAVSYYTVIYYPVKLIISSISGDEKSEIITAKIISLFLIISIGKLIRKNKSLVTDIQRVRSRFWFIAGLCGFLDNGIIYFVDYFTQSVEGRGVTVVKVMNAIVNLFVYFLGIFFIYADVIRQKLVEDNLIKDKYLKMSKEHFQEISSHMQEVRAVKHDMKSHINSLETYIKDKDYSAALQYIERIQNRRIFEVNILNLVGNKMVDSVISYTMGEHKEIRISCEGSLPENFSVSDYDLCTIFSNLVSNAAEACEKLKESEKVIGIKAGRYKTYFVIAVWNPVEWEIDVEHLGKNTAKEEKTEHGYGVNNVRNTVKNLGGKLFFDVTDNIFKVKIILEMN